MTSDTACPFCGIKKTGRSLRCHIQACSLRDIPIGKAAVETAGLIKKLSSLLDKPPRVVIALALFRMATTYRLTGVGQEWEAEAVKRGYRRKRR